MRCIGRVHASKTAVGNCCILGASSTTGFLRVREKKPKLFKSSSNRLVKFSALSTRFQCSSDYRSNARGRAAEQTPKTGTLEELRVEADRQELAVQIAERQAKVAQELALARRIETADDMEMEEFYDVGGAAHVGLKSGEGSISAGVGSQGQKVARRIYRFKNNARSGTLE
jgi:hypothetical protein